MIAVPNFPAPNPADPQNERQFREMVSATLKGLARAVSGGSPEVSTAFSRTGSVITATHTITDPGRSFLSMEFQYNAGGWLDTWDTEVTGSSYEEDVTLTPGTDAIYEIRLGYANENGQRKYKQQAFNLADLQAVTKYRTVSFAELEPVGPTQGHFKGLGNLTVNTDDGVLWSFVAGLSDVPVGAVLTSIRVRAREGSAANTGPVTYLRYKDSSDVVQTLATIDHAGEATAAWKTDTSPNHTVAQENAYYLLMQMQWTAAEPTAPVWYAGEIEYTVADYSKTR